MRLFNACWPGRCRWSAKPRFNPQPRLVFALSLPLGVVGCEEVVELELDEVLPLEQLQERLVRQLPPGLDLLTFRRVGTSRRAFARRD